MPTEETTVLETPTLAEGTTVETVTPKEKKQRGRNSAPTKNYKAFFPTEKQADDNPPTTEKFDSSGTLISSEISEAYRTYRIKVAPPIIGTSDKGQPIYGEAAQIVIPADFEMFVAARSGDQALSFFAEDMDLCGLVSEVANPQHRGRARKYDPMMIKYLVQMITFEFPSEELEGFYSADDGKFEHYRRLDLSGVQAGPQHKASNTEAVMELIIEHCTKA